MRACWREGGGDASETERERGRERDGIMNNEYRIDNNNVVEGGRERERKDKISSVGKIRHV